MLAGKPVDTPALIIADDADHCLATWDRTFIQIWRRATSERAVGNMCAAARSFAAKHPEGFNLLFIVEPASEIPGSAARAEFARCTKETVARATCAAVVPEGGSFRSALVRSIVVGLTTLLRQSFPYKFVDSLDAAIDLLGPHLSPAAGGRDALRRAVTDLRARITPAK